MKITRTVKRYEYLIGEVKNGALSTAGTYFNYGKDEEKKVIKRVKAKGYNNPVIMDKTVTILRAEMDIETFINNANLMEV